MKKIFFTPGPTQLFPTVKAHLKQALKNDICSISHRSKIFDEIFANTVRNLKKLLNIPDEFQVFFHGSATESMERIIENCVEQKSCHFVNGVFSDRFRQNAQELNKKTQVFKVDLGKIFDFDNCEIDKDAELICLTHSETSAGVMIELENIYKIKKKYPDKLIALDIVSSAPYASPDFNKLDAVFFSVQKGFGMPAGMGVLMVNQKCLNKARSLQKKGLSIGSYHNFLTMNEYALKSETPETPNVLGIYLLGKVCADMIAYGIDKIRKETEQKAELVYNFFENRKDYELLVKEKTARSKTVINIETPGGSSPIIQKLATKGFIIGSGYGVFKDAQIRIANFPTHNKKNLEALLKLI